MMDIHEAEETNSSGPKADIKYELFCKWLRQNEQLMGQCTPNEMHDAMLSNSFTSAPNPIATEDEVSSIPSNSDDGSGNDVFLDTETDFPAIVLTEAIDNGDVFGLNEHAADDLSASCATAVAAMHATQPWRSDTPSQLSVNDFDCSASDTTVHSRTSNVSTESQVSSGSKRKAKHKKGPAPPIPSATPSVTAHVDLVHESNEPHCIEITTYSHIETDI